MKSSFRSFCYLFITCLSALSGLPVSSQTLYHEYGQKLLETIHINKLIQQEVPYDFIEISQEYSIRLLKEPEIAFDVIKPAPEQEHLVLPKSEANLLPPFVEIDPNQSDSSPTPPNNDINAETYASIAPLTSSNPTTPSKNFRPLPTLSSLALQRKGSERPEPFDFREFKDNKNNFLVIALYSGRHPLAAEWAYENLYHSAHEPKKLNSPGSKGFLAYIQEQIEPKEQFKIAEKGAFDSIAPIETANPEKSLPSQSEVSPPYFGELTVVEKVSKPDVFYDSLVRSYLKKKYTKVASHYILVYYSEALGLTVELSLTDAIGTPQELVYLGQKLEQQLRQQTGLKGPKVFTITES